MGKYTKTILAFVGLVVTNLAANLGDGSTVAPHTAGDWWRLVVTTAVGSAVVYYQRNELTADQIKTALGRLEVTVPQLHAVIDDFYKNYAPEPAPAPAPTTPQPGPTV